MKKLTTTLAGFLPVIALVGIATYATAENRSEGPSRVTVAPSTSAVTLPTVTTTTEPVSEIELRLDKRQEELVTQALDWVNRTWPSEYQRMETEHGWTILPLEGDKHDNLALTSDDPWTQTAVDFLATKANARAIGLPEYEWLAVILVHEWTHVDGHMDSEYPSVRAQIAFCKHWPAGQDHDRCLSTSVEDLSRIDPATGDWRGQ